MADYGDLNPVANGGRSGSFMHKTVDVTKVNVGNGESGEMMPTSSSGGWGAYGGAWWGRYMPWYWLLWVFLIPIIIFIILMVFPPSCILYTNPTTGIQTLDLTRLFFISLFVGWFIVLIFWIISAWC